MNSLDSLDIFKFLRQFFAISKFITCHVIVGLVTNGLAFRRRALESFPPSMPYDQTTDIPDVLYHDMFNDMVGIII